MQQDHKALQEHRAQLVQQDLVQQALPALQELVVLLAYREIKAQLALLDQQVVQVYKVYRDQLER